MGLVGTRSCDEPVVHFRDGLSPRRALQVRGSASQTREVLRRHFQELQAGVSRLLNERLGLLLVEVDAIEQDSVRPLDDCQKLIEHGVGAADELLREGEPGHLIGNACLFRAPPTVGGIAPYSHHITMKCRNKNDICKQNPNYDELGLLEC